MAARPAVSSLLRVLGPSARAAARRSATSRALAARGLSRGVRLWARAAASAAHTGVPARWAATTAASSAPSPSLADNPLLQLDAGLPAFSSVRAEHVVPAVRAALADFEEGVQRLNSSAASDGEVAASEAIALCDAVERVYDPLTRVWGVVSHLNGVVQTPELRAAYEEVQPEVTEALTRFSQSIYPALSRVSKADGGAVVAALDPARRRVIEILTLEAEQAGAALPDKQREELTALMVSISAAGSRFTNNVMDSVTPDAYALDVTDPSDVAGMPASVLAAAAQTAEEGASQESGPWRFTLDQSSFVPFMQHCQNRELRERVYRAYVAIASSDGRDNSPVIRDILATRRKIAAMLGYPNYAEVSIAKKMARDASEVVALLERLREKCYEPAKAELDRLRTFAKGEGFDGELEQWDIPFWSERQLEAKFGLRDDVIRPYFSLPRVLAGMFDTVGRVFGVRIVAADGEADVWHKDVRFFHVMASDTGNPIASFYLDPYARPGSKRGGAWMDTCLNRSGVVTPGPLDMAVQLPVAYMVCNQAPPVASDGSDSSSPPLMRFSEVVTLFHEFGHALQHMLTSVNVGMVSGISGVEWDAVELPSQWMEQWAYHPQTLRAMTAHVETGEPLPEVLIDNLRASRVHNAAMSMLRQLFLARLDLELHLQDSECDAEVASATLNDPFGVARQVADRYSLMAPLPEDKFLCKFMHIFSASYASGYYSYKWAEVLAADAWGAFEAAGLDDDAAVREIGGRFRRTVLGLGGSHHASEVFREFRGRDPDEDALLQLYGLAAS